MTGRTASVLLTDDEVSGLDLDLRLLYRPLSIHWDGQFGKFLEPRQVTIVGFEAQDIIHLMKDTGRTHEGGRPIVVKIESRVLRRISDKGVFPEDYRIKYENLEAGMPCWVVVLGHKVGT